MKVRTMYVSCWENIKSMFYVTVPKGKSCFHYFILYSGVMCNLRCNFNKTRHNDAKIHNLQNQSMSQYYLRS